MNDKINKLLLGGIFLCLVFIAIKPTNIQVTYPSTNAENDNSKEQIIQLAPNRIAVIDNSSSDSNRSGIMLVFEYDEDRRVFDYVSSMNYMDYLGNPEF